MIWGGAKRMGGGKRTRERALPKNSGPLQKSFWSAQSWIFVQEKQSNDTRGGWKTYRTRGVQNPFLGGVSFVSFSSPLFFHPPMASSQLKGRAHGLVFKHPNADPHAPRSTIFLNSVQTRCIVKARLRKVHFSGEFLGAFDFLRIACSLGVPQENL